MLAKIKLQLPNGFEAQIRTRSGLALKAGVTILNTPGTIDTEYRGELVAIMINFSNDPFIVKRGSRICRLAIREIPKIELKLVNKVTGTSRNSKGFGSSGV